MVEQAEEGESVGTPKVKWEARERVVQITLANPPANVLSRQTLLELDQAVEMAASDPRYAVVVITGEGNMFAAGADIKELADVRTAQEGQELSLLGQRVFDNIERMTKPVIAMINGACLGGGLELAMACHLRIAASSAKLGLPELNLGLIPGFGGTQRLMSLIGRDRALEMILRGDALDGEQAHAAGLVTRSVPLDRLEETVFGLARTIASRSEQTVRATMEAIACGVEEGKHQGMKREAELFGELFEMEDAKEGIRAFLEKRPPVFRNH